MCRAVKKVHQRLTQKVLIHLVFIIAKEGDKKLRAQGARNFFN